ncbi:MAG: hypothetical protein HY966_05325 [Ignavibacteriales bacterium]|nr:hypothetical protein [Ignavibacteriales bacterium]
MVTNLSHIHRGKNLSEYDLHFIDDDSPSGSVAGKLGILMFLVAYWYFVFRLIF